ncbi:putative disease resistance protein RGA4 [Vicia villosa]|uniref:putative disease resistance protein RGA4 n=1 Tax=Vicia villosa TaxID=3911 RepID=UPI00273B4406|nr:putative disease resistance protein RGA4 [Vicia villosa]
MANALLGVVFKNLSSLIQNEFATIFGIEKKAQKLSATLELINAVLEDAEHKQLNNPSIKLWLQQLKDAVYVLDDILDQCFIESDRLQGVSSFIPKNIMFRREIGNKFKEIISRFDQIAVSKNKFLLQVGGPVREKSIEVAEWRQTSSVIAEPKVYGRDDDKEKIVQFFLTQARDSHSLSVYPIVGLGGIGKTTLAQLVYNDRRVSVNFDIKVWVCVSEVFSIKMILLSIIESITRGKRRYSNLDVIQKKVQELLQGKKYLLVLDDVWKRNPELEFGLSQDIWYKLKSVLSCGSKGASILVSTRDKDVAEIMGTCQSHHLSGLSEDECWLLFQEYAFGHEKEKQAKLVAIGKEIIKKCGGLPLAAQALGGLMHSRTTEKEWLEIKDSELWTLPDENMVFPALRLSYIYLTPTLKQCFSFCAIFPKDTEMIKEDLIHLWMANGFISSRENLEVEDVGNMVWNELCQKSFFQDIKMYADSEEISFKMHDLVHDLAQFVTGPECMIIKNTNIDLSRSTHHISFDYRKLVKINQEAFRNVESLRTLYGLKTSDCPTFYFSCRFPNNNSLRVLLISSRMLYSVESFTHLRYLELYGFSNFEPISSSIHTLRYLEILKFKSFWKILYLPKHLSRLQNLRHLVIEDCNVLSSVFPNIGKLCCLRTLSLFIVRREIGYSLAELRDLQLEGKLSIQGLKNVGSSSEAREANLMAKKDLQELRLSWSKGVFTKGPSTSAEEVIEALQPHSNLKRLKIELYDGISLPSWISMLSNLASLELTCCDNCVQTSLLGKLPSLKKVRLRHMNNVLYMNDDEPHHGLEETLFPSLEELYLDGLPNLERLLKVLRGEIFPRLSNFTIINCPKLVLPNLSSVKYLFVDGCNNELLRQISSFYGLTTLHLNKNEDVTSLPEDMLRKLTSLQTLTISDFLKLMELPNEPFNLALEHLCISRCGGLESLPELIWEGLQSLRTIDIIECEGLRSLPEGFQHLTSLEVLTIQGCSTLKKRCKEEIGEDWDKIAHIPKLLIW